MATLTLDLDPETIRLLREAADESGLSLEGWLKRLIHTRASGRWPAGVVALAGAWADDVPSAEEIRASEAPDLPRESVDGLD